MDIGVGVSVDIVVKFEVNIEVNVGTWNHREEKGRKEGRKEK